ncbi:MAG TPA: transporter [Desulfobacteraceae bacterium]|nr:transporter [Desulfobacteraceae bacterium]
MLFRTIFSRLTAYLKLLKNLFVWSLCVFLILGLPILCLAQELEPRRWSHLPTGTNFLGGGYAYTEANILFDPVLRIEDAEMEMHTWTVKFIRTFELFQKSARIDLTQAYQEGRWTGLLNGAPASIKRRGLSDSILRFAINLYGAPPLEGKEFAAYRAKVDVETIFGTALVVHLPTGDYMNDKLINLGTNRFTFRPQLGVVHNRGKWSFELTGAVWLYTENNDFFNGSKLEQDPYFTAQTHLIYSFRPGLWASASAGYGDGGKSTINGVEKNDRKKNLAWAFSFGFPITRQLGVKVAYLATRTQESIGQDSDSIGAAFSIFW